MFEYIVAVGIMALLALVTLAIAVNCIIDGIRDRRTMDVFLGVIGFLLFVLMFASVIHFAARINLG